MTAVFAVVAVGMILAGCKKAEPPSPIVKEVEDAGAGDVSKASAESLQTWFKQHWDLAYRIKLECSKVEPTKAADWRETTEGRVCKAAYGATLSGNKPMQPDDKRY
jgi:hypothetical protein